MITRGGFGLLIAPIVDKAQISASCRVQFRANCHGSGLVAIPEPALARVKGLKTLEC